MAKGTFPEIIKMLPQVDIGIDGVKGWLIQGKQFQLGFFEIESGIKIALHTHAAQFGIMFEGSATSTINGKTTHLKQGDSYYIPEGAVHSWETRTFVRAMDFYADPQRYKTSDKEPE